MKPSGTLARLTLAALPLLLGAAPVSQERSSAIQVPESKIDPWLDARLDQTGRASFLVRFDSTDTLRGRLANVGRGPDQGRAVYDLLRQRARAAQSGVRAWLKARSIPYRPLYVINALQVEGDLALARSLAAMPEVTRILGDPKVEGVPAPAVVAGESVEWGVQAIHAPQVWSSDGVVGSGIVVASADTGVEWNHPALLAHYRGWDGQAASHDFNWHDSIQDLATPLDDYGHGTHTTGTMVGDDGAGNQIGVAPGALWIACRNMDHGVGQPSTYLECIQYFLAPWPHGGDPESDGDPSRAPQIVNNSWGCPPSEGCDPLSLEDGFAALEAAGILAVVSAGNSGPSCSSVNDPPAIYGEGLVVGATGSSGTLTSFSSRGPVTSDGSGRLRPDLSAPGAGVRSAVRGGAYTTLSGTSMAGPHVAGAAALLWSARPEFRGKIGLTRCELTRTAGPVHVSAPQTCGGTSETDIPNNLFGWGLVDAWAAIHPALDSDQDGVADGCDCAKADPGAFELPGEIRDVTMDADRVKILWSSPAEHAGTGTVSDMVRGDLADLLKTGSIEAGKCLATGLSGNSFSDAEVPSPGLAYYYVVRGRNACGKGGWGFTSSGTPRTHTGCP